MLISAGEDFLRLGDAGEDVAAERAQRGRELGRREQPMVEALGRLLEPRRERGADDLETTVDAEDQSRFSRNSVIAASRMLW